MAFMGAAATLILTAPFIARDLAAELPLYVISAVVLVAAAALTSPWNKTIIMADAALAGAGFVVMELWALGGFAESGPVAFLLRQALAIIFMFAFYFAMKTFRAMMIGQIGRTDSEIDLAVARSAEDDEELKEAQKAAARQQEWQDQALREKGEYDN